MEKLQELSLVDVEQVAGGTTYIDTGSSCRPGTTDWGGGGTGSTAGGQTALNADLGIRG